MPLSEKGKRIKAVMQKTYGKEKGKKVLFASKNKGTISGVDSPTRADVMETIKKRSKKY